MVAPFRGSVFLLVMPLDRPSHVVDDVRPISGHGHRHRRREYGVPQTTQRAYGHDSTEGDGQNKFLRGHVESQVRLVRDATPKTQSFNTLVSGRG